MKKMFVGRIGWVFFFMSKVVLGVLWYGVWCMFGVVCLYVVMYVFDFI